LLACGAYLRTDFWIRTGTIDGPSLLRMRILGRISRPLPGAGHYGQLDQAGVRQAVMDEPPQTEDRTRSSWRPFIAGRSSRLPARQAPAYLRRLAAGGTAGAEVNQRLGIPYIVEHPGFDAMLHEALGRAGSLMRSSTHG
jgi:hypothetical protein